jgi:hypothetical protein
MVAVAAAVEVGARAFEGNIYRDYGADNSAFVVILAGIVLGLRFFT